MLPWLSSPFHTEKFALWLVKRLESIPHDDDICGVFCFSRHFPDVPPVILNMYPLNIYTHMNAVRMCCERDLDPPNILQSFKATFFTLNDISTYSPSVNRILSDCHSQGRRLFSEGKFTKSRSGGLTVMVISTQALFTFFARDRCSFLGRSIGRTNTSLRTAVVFFPSNKLPKTLTTVLLFGHVTLLCRTLSLFSWVRDLCSYQTVRSTCWLIRSHRFGSPMLHLWLHRTVSPLTASETLTQRWRHRIGAGSLLWLFLSLFNITLKCLKEPEFGKVQIDLMSICTLQCQCNFFGTLKSKLTSFTLVMLGLRF